MTHLFTILFEICLNYVYIGLKNDYYHNKLIIQIIQMWVKWRDWQQWTAMLFKII